MIGKEDWLTGGHSLNTMIDSFSIYSRWPYNIPEEGGFHVWGDCGVLLHISVYIQSYVQCKCSV